MAARLELRQFGVTAPISRIGYYSQWQFKKQRMTGFARQLGILNRFYFRAYTDSAKAWAEGKAEGGEKAQLAKLEAANDYLLVGQEWEDKRFARFQLPTALRTGNPTTDAELKLRAYAERTAHLEPVFPKTFAALKAMRCTTSAEIAALAAQRTGVDMPVLMKEIQAAKLQVLQQVFKDEVLDPKPVNG
jgi:hypothetical protein